MVGGVYNGLLTNQTWYNDVSTGIWMDGGLLESAPVYRTAAVTSGDTVYHMGGSTGSFSYTGLSDKRVDIICSECVIPGFSKQATEVALPGQTIHYTISIDPMVNDTALITDFLPDPVEYVPGSLSVSPNVGIYDYYAPDRVVWWSNSLIVAKTNSWTPAQKTGTSSSADLPAQSKEPVALAQVESLDYTIDSVLWDQPLSVFNQNAYVNQEFTDSPDLSSFLADDFEAAVPWLIDTIFVPGNGWNGFSTLFNATALTFMIYEDDGGSPAAIHLVAVRCLFGRIPCLHGPTNCDHKWNRRISVNTLWNLFEPILLPAGHYWLIFYPT
jgi:uncharacterized repeat protein (TIGR01451 family)